MELKYGSTTLHLEIPQERLLGCLNANSPIPEESPEQIIAASLDGCRDTMAGFCPEEKVVIVTSDITRYTASEIYLPLLVERLNAQGVKDSNIEIVIALGIHRKQTEDEHRKILGALHGRIRVSDHDCDDSENLVLLGQTSNGIDVMINRQVAEADKVILTGAIGFHYFAGFSGGRKSILPGVASRKACMASHFAVLNPEDGGGKNPLAATGILDGNPVHDAMDEACGMVCPALILNTILSPDKRLIAAFTGDWREAHRKGCEYYSRYYSVPIASKADLVVVSCGGFPKDINFIQAHKSMEYASRALKDGGVMILLAQCRDGYGNPTFFNWFRHRDLDVLEAELRRNYEINGQTAYSTLQKTTRFRVILVSEIPPPEVEAMGMTAAGSLDVALRLATKTLPPLYSAFIIPDGGIVLPVFKN
jgi:nickel-dependent lactate racemase